jgi:hypothetical protein
LGKKNKKSAHERETLPERLPTKAGQTRVEVHVEGYDDVAFWRTVFNDFESDRVTFEISVPPRPDLAKGKRVVMDMIDECSPIRLLCVDSDFDYLFNGQTGQSRRVLETPYLFHTYTYATENYLCWAPALHNVCTKATKNDTRIFDFEAFMAGFSSAIYDVFVWYAYSALLGDEHIFKLIDFKNTVRLHYLEVERGGESTLHWLRGNADRKRAHLEENHPGHVDSVNTFKKQLSERGVTRENVYLFMHGHTLLDNVVTPMVSAVCEKLKLLAGDRIATSAQRGVALGNEISNYRNALVNVRDALVYNENYKDCPLYLRLHNDIADMLRKQGLL